MRKAVSRLRGLRFIPIALGALVLTGSALTAPGATGTIDTVGGQGVSGGKVKQPLSGEITVAGRAGVAGGGETTPPGARPLVADAGDSAFVAAGSAATLLGSGFGGTEP